MLNVIVFVTVVQLILSGILLLKMLSLPHCDEFKHRVVSFVFAAIGSSTLTAGLFYFPEFSWTRTFLLGILTLTCLTFLTYSKWSIPKVCYRLQLLFKGSC